MTIIRHTVPLAVSSLLVLAACSADDISPADHQTQGAAVEPLERRLGLIPQIINAADLPETGRTLEGTVTRYVILSTEAGVIDIDSIGVASEEGDAHSLAELFTAAPPVQTGRIERDALLLLAVSEDDVQQLCERFLLAHDDADLVTVERQQLLFLASAPEGRTHALCLLPTNENAKDAAHDTINERAATGGTQNYGAGTYTVRVKSLRCNDPRDWENWPYNGDEGRMRAFYDGMGGSQIWSADRVKSGNNYSPNRYIHFSSNVRLELFDYDSAPWNASDMLGAVSIYSSDACYGDRRADFDGRGGGHNWNYDLTYRVYGPACPCQSQEPAVPTTSDAETCSVTSSTITDYTWYCSGGIYWRQAWGDVMRHCETVRRTYNESCEMKTFVSSTLLSECDKYAYHVVIGSPMRAGTCESDPCGPQPLPEENLLGHPNQLIPPPECSGSGDSEM